MGKVEISKGVQSNVRLFRIMEDEGARKIRFDQDLSSFTALQN